RTQPRSRRRRARPPPLHRARLGAIQTPQAFLYDGLLAAHRRASAVGRDDFTDDAALAEWAGMAVTVFEGESGNVKLTTEEDFSRITAGHWGAPRGGRTGAADHGPVLAP